MFRTASLLGCAVCVWGCGSTSSPTNSGAAPVQVPDAEASKPEAKKAPELGGGDHTPNSVTFTEIASGASGVKTPRDLAFNPRKPDELWIVNFGDDSVVIVHDASSDGRTTERRKDIAANHFMPKPAGIAFGQDETSFGVPGTFATCNESRNTYDGKHAHNDFMGPALWSSDLTIFARRNPHDLGSHLDMLHMTPLCVGIAHEAADRYWVFGGLKNSIDRYDFKVDHDIGQDDHSDGEFYQYVTGQVKYVEGVPGHLFYREADATLYIADTGNKRVAKLDTTSGRRGRALQTPEPMEVAVMMDGATLSDVVPADSGLLEQPSGLEVRGDILYVSDHANGRISAFSMDGERLNYLDTGLPPGSLAGLNFGPDGKLYVVDMIGNRVLRIDPK